MYARSNRLDSLTSAVGVGSDFFTNIILTILGYFPGALVHVR